MVRTKLAYPKMPGGDGAVLGRCVAFEKYDGSNLHWLWDADLGWCAFGVRRDRFDLDAEGIAAFAKAHTELQEAAQLFQSTLAGDLTLALQSHQFYESKQILAFTEFLGDHSFAGRHRASDPKRLVLFDILTDQGFLPPDEFITHFDSLPIARVVFQGKFTGRFAQDVREGRYDVQEGVVCKGCAHGNVWMAKIKTHAYMERLKEAFGSDWENYWE